VGVHFAASWYFGGGKNSSSLLALDSKSQLRTLSNSFWS